MNYGYVRVSTREQNEHRQLIAMDRYGVTEIITDNESGKNFDRLGRNYADIIEQWRIITKVKGASIVVIEMPLLDTRKQKDLMGTLISDSVLELLSYVAQTEREFNRKRSAEGLAAAKARGVVFGRPRLAKTESYYEALDAWRDGLSATKAAEIAGISRNKFRAWAREEE